MYELNDPNQSGLFDYVNIDETPNTVWSFFSGGGLMDLGFKQAGYDVVVATEIDKHASSIHQENMPGVDLITESIHRLSVKDLLNKHGRPEVICGGFPCTPYSKAANMNGTRLHDNNHKNMNNYSKYASLGGDLFLHYVRMVAYAQPKAFVVENVMELTGMRIIMEALKDMPCTRTGEKFGSYYNLTYTKVNTADFGLPQKRERIFVIGVAKNPNGKPPLPESNVQMNHVPGEILEYEPDVAGVTKPLPPYILNRLAGAYRDKPSIKGIGADVVSNTCVAHYHRDQGTTMVDRGDGLITPYSVREYANLQGIPKDWVIPKVNSSYRVIGNGVSVPVANSVARLVRQIA